MHTHHHSSQNVAASPFNNHQLDTLFQTMTSMVEHETTPPLGLIAINQAEVRGLPYSMLVFTREHDHHTYYEALLLAGSNVAQQHQPSSIDTLNSDVAFYQAVIEMTVKTHLNGKSGKVAKIKILPAHLDTTSEKNIRLWIHQAMDDIEHAIQMRQ